MKQGKAVTRKSGAKEEAGATSPSDLIDARIADLGDWRGEILARVRKIIKQADPDVVEEVKWRKPSRDHPKKVRSDIAERVQQFAWRHIPVQWIEKADHDIAEKAFFRINQGGTKIDATEKRILSARRSAAALSARAILRRGTGNNYWDKFTPDIQEKK